MPLNGEFTKTVWARAGCDPEFRVGLLSEAVEELLSNDVETGKVLLCHYADATLGFETLANELERSPRSLMRMLSSGGNPRADDLLATIAFLKQREGLSLSLKRDERLPA